MAEYEKKIHDKGVVHLSIEALFKEKLAKMEHVALHTIHNQVEQKEHFNVWDTYFSPTGVDKFTQLTLHKLLAVISQKGPQYQSLDRAVNFFKDAEENMKKLNDIVNEENDKRRSKRIEEIADISSVCEEIKAKIAAMSANLNMFNNKEKEKVGIIQDLAKTIKY